MKTLGYAASIRRRHALAPFAFERRALRPNDVAMEILYCGVCHSDLHLARNDWGWSTYPLVPGHEIVGRVIAVGPEVTRFKAGDAVAVGCMVDSCQQCDQCRKGEEQLCREGNTLTYSGPDRITREITYGGYSKHRRGAAGVRAARAGRPRPRPRGAAALRRHHHLFAAAHLERRPGQPGRRDRARRPRPHGGQARVGPRRARHGAQPHRRTRRPMRWRSAPIGSWSRRTRTRWQRPRRSFDLIIDTVPRQARPQRLPAAAGRRRYAGDRRPARHRSPSRPPCR